MERKCWLVEWWLFFFAFRFLLPMRFQSIDLIWRRRRKKEINQYDAFSLLSIKQSMFFSLFFSRFATRRICVFLIKHLCFIISITTKPNFHCYFNFLLVIQCTHTLLLPILLASFFFFVVFYSFSFVQLKIEFLMKIFLPKGKNEIYRLEKIVI